MSTTTQAPEAAAAPSVDAERIELLLDKIDTLIELSEEFDAIDAIDTKLVSKVRKQIYRASVDLIFAMTEDAVPASLCMFIAPVEDHAQRVEKAIYEWARSFDRSHRSRRNHEEPDAPDDPRVTTSIGGIRGFRNAHRAAEERGFVPTESLALLKLQGVSREQVARMHGISEADIQKEWDQPGSGFSGPEYEAPTDKIRKMQVKNPDRQNYSNGYVLRNCATNIRQAIQESGLLQSDASDS